MKRIVYTRPDGGVSIITPCISIDDPDDFTETKAIERALKSVPADATGVRIAGKTEFPTDRTFRDAWRNRGGRIEVDMPHAREIRRAQLRVERAPLLQALDTDYMRADERSDADAKRLIAARKQKLRDATADPRIDSAQTPEELKQVVL